MRLHPWLWIGFGLLLLTALIVELNLFRPRSRELGMKEAVLRSASWVALALLFSLGICYRQSEEKALQFLAGYVIELSLSVDNLLVFLFVFTFFQVPPQPQHKVLFWGMLGALITRAVFIALGIMLIQLSPWVRFLFGAVLVLGSVRMFGGQKKTVEPENNPVLRLFRHFFPVSESYHSDRFFTKSDGRVAATPLFMVLVVVESTDLVFALDSVPAVLAITTDPLIVYTSNIFAILCLRSLFFALAGVLAKIRFLRYGLTAMLLFVGAKMLVADWYRMPTSVSLVILASLLAFTVAASLIWHH